VDGVQGTFINRPQWGRRPAGYNLLWVKNGVIHSLVGRGDAAPAVALADSLQQGRKEKEERSRQKAEGRKQKAENRRHEAESSQRYEPHAVRRPRVLPHQVWAW